MIIAALWILAITSTSPDSITVRTFSLVTSEGENVLHEDFDRRRLSNSFGRLALKFNAIGKQFKFEFRRTYPIFAPDASIKMTSRVSECENAQTNA